MAVETCNHDVALDKVAQAVALLIEAYHLLPTAEVRRAIDRLSEAFRELGGINIDEQLSRTPGP